MADGQTSDLPTHARVATRERDGDDDAAGPRGSEYAVLSRLVRAARLLDRAPRKYAGRIVITLGVFVACWYVLGLIGASWLALIAAGALGLASTQIAFLGHDGGHQQISNSRAGNLTVGLIAGNLLTGLSIGWWIDKHSRHHANPNREDHDPDIGEGVLAFTTAHAAGRRGPIATAITRYQAFLFFPLLLLEGFNLHVASVQYLRRRPGAPLRRTEIALLALHLVGYFTVLLLVLPPAHAVAFLGVHQAVFGFSMGCSFAPNHKGMPIVGAHEKLDHLRRQVLTSRNIRGGWFIDHALGGLNYQIEHHLFPSMPRANLRRAQTLVRAFCDAHQVSYTETSLFTSYAMALRHLHELGRPLRGLGPAA